MSDYTPTTEDVKKAISAFTVMPPGERAVTLAEFYRWLNQVKAEAWDEGNNQAWQDCENGAEFGEPNPYRKEQ